MKKSLLFIAMLFIASIFYAQTYWTGDMITFSKESGADWTLEENQDRITDDVWITRANSRGIFNIAQEESYNGETGTPAGTEWALGEITDGVENLTFTSWVDAVDSEPPFYILQNMVLHLIEEDIYIDIVFTDWGIGDFNGLGSVEYVRASSDAPLEEPTPILWRGIDVTFTRNVGDDGSLEENQDRMTDNLWLTGEDPSEGNEFFLFLYNASSQNPDEMSPATPLNTLWAIGNLDDGVENLEFGTFTFIMDDYEASDLINVDLVLKIMDAYIYMDFKFTEWTLTETENSFTYVRSSDMLNITSKQSNNIKIYPSITADIINIDGLNTDTEYQIYNYLGELILSGNTNGKLNVSNLNNGMYIINIGNKTLKFIKK